MHIDTQANPSLTGLAVVMPTVKTRKLRDGQVSYYVRLRDPVRRKETSETLHVRRSHNGIQCGYGPRR
jgi:hypothetical protein